ncbi:MAG: DUF4325 domain-containing protein [Candidatus Paceibacterota bacterium]|jgi:hypothetical protein
MNIDIKKFGTTLISRQSGKEAFAAFQPILKDALETEDLIIDFNGVITFSPSWGDEFLTPIVRIYGDRSKFKNTKNPSVRAAIEILEKANNIKFNIID